MPENANSSNRLISGRYFSHTRKKSGQTHTECLLIRLAENQESKYHFSLINPIMLTDFMQSGLFHKCSSVWNYETNTDPQHQQTGFVCSNTEDIERIHQYIRSSPIHNSRAQSILSPNLSANDFGAMVVASIPDSWVMFGYCHVPQRLKSWRVHTCIQSCLASMFPYPADQLSFDYVPVPSSMQPVIKLAQQNNAEQPGKKTRLYQVMACVQVQYL